MLKGFILEDCHTGQAEEKGFWRWLSLELMNAGYDLKSTLLLQAKFSLPGTWKEVSSLAPKNQSWQVPLWASRGSFSRDTIKQIYYCTSFSSQGMQAKTPSKPLIYQIQIKDNQCQEIALKKKSCHYALHWLRAVEALPGQGCCPSDAGGNQHLWAGMGSTKVQSTTYKQGESAGKTWALLVSRCAYQNSSLFQ